MKNEKSKTENYGDKLIRILSKDIDGNLNLYAGFTKIKGISWSMSNAICKNLKLDKKRKIGSLSKEEIEKINNFMKKGIPSFLMNRKIDPETGEDRHLVGSDLELQKEFDIGKLKKMKCYKGYRHISGLPLRGQRTKGNFRRHKKKGVGIKKKNKPGETKK